MGGTKLQPLAAIKTCVTSIEIRTTNVAPIIAEYQTFVDKFLRIPLELKELYSKRLRFISITQEIIDKVIEGNDTLSSFLSIDIPDDWTEFGTDPFLYVRKKLIADPGSEGWWGWLVVLRDQNALIGNSGYKGPPGDNAVEIGYEVSKSLRGMGLATEIAAVLVDHAFTFSEVLHVLAHTLAEENASCNVLRKCGFHFVKEIDDPEDGKIWQWRIDRDVVAV